MQTIDPVQTFANDENAFLRPKPTHDTFYILTGGCEHPPVKILCILLLTIPVAFIFLSPFTILDGATENRVIARALAPVAIRSPCRQRRRGALHRKKTDSHDQFANRSRNDRGGCPHPPENISDGTMWASSPTILLPQDLLFAFVVI